MKNLEIERPPAGQQRGQSKTDLGKSYSQAPLVSSAAVEHLANTLAARMRWRPPAADLARERHLTGPWWSDLPRKGRR